MIHRMNRTGLSPGIARACVELGMKRHGSSIPVFLVIAALWCGAAQAQSAPADERGEVTFRPWIGTLGVRFHSEGLYEEAALAPFPGSPRATGELSGQASAAGLQGLGLGGEWRPFGNNFRLNFAMYLDSGEAGESESFRSRTLSEDGSASEDLISLPQDFEPVPYVGLGWRANDGALDVNLDVGAFLSEDYSLRGSACLGTDSSLDECEAASFGNNRGRLSGSFRGFEWYPVVSLGIEYRF